MVRGGLLGGDQLGGDPIDLLTFRAPVGEREGDGAGQRGGIGECGVGGFNDKVPLDTLTKGLLPPAFRIGLDQVAGHREIVGAYEHEAADPGRYSAVVLALGERRRAIPWVAAVAEAEQTDQHVASEHFAVVELNCRRGAGAKIFHRDRSEAVKAVDRSQHSLAMGHEILAGRAEKDFVGHGAAPIGRRNPARLTPVCRYGSLKSGSPRKLINPPLKAVSTTTGDFAPCVRSSTTTIGPSGSVSREGQSVISSSS